MVPAYGCCDSGSQCGSFRGRFVLWSLTYTETLAPEITDDDGDGDVTTELPLVGWWGLVAVALSDNDDDDDVHGLLSSSQADVKMHSDCYINYSNIAARLLRKALKPELSAQTVRRDYSHSATNNSDYINYSNIAARLLRKALKPELRAQAVRRDDSHIKFTKWQNGKPESK
uniref:ATP synthase subunit epsilon, mitochondrial n=1 Tax=Anopheles coluzzii TaxID=1518534 RepID=A0A8W7P9P9_ANOCL